MMYHGIRREKNEAALWEREDTEMKKVLKIMAPDGNILYQGKGSEVEQFTLNLPASGSYPLQVEAKRWEGSLHIECTP